MTELELRLTIHFLKDILLQFYSFIFHFTLGTISSPIGTYGKNLISGPWVDTYANLGSQKQLLEDCIN